MASEATFFSYSRVDSAFVLRLAKDLREAGFNIWLDQLDIRPGSRWDDAIQEALDDAKTLIVILTPTSVASQNVMDEVSFAIGRKLNVIPVLLNDCETPFRLSRFQRIDFTGDYQAGLNYLIETLNYYNASKHETGSAGHEKDLPPTTVLDARPFAAQQQKEEADNALWEEAVKINSTFSYRKYINESATGSHVKEARQCINKIKVERKDKKLEKQFWEKAKAENTFRSFHHYLAQYPKGNYKEDALASIFKINQILNEEREAKQKIKQLEFEQTEMLAQQFWENAKTEDTINSYSGYLQQYPYGLHRADASAAIKQIEDAEKQKQKRLRSEENVTSPNVKNKGSSKKYYLIVGSIVVIGVIIWGVMKISTPVPGKAQISKQTDSVGLMQPTTISANQGNKVPNIDSTNAKVDRDSAFHRSNSATTALKQDRGTVNENKKISTENNKPKSPYKIGQRYGGGIIYYIDETGKHGLIAATADQGTANWNDAVKICKDCKDGGYLDWHLPSKDEQHNLGVNNKAVGGFVRGNYWSSTEYDNGDNTFSASELDDAWTLCFIDCNGRVVDALLKNSQGHFRAVRAF